MTFITKKEWNLPKGNCAKSHKLREILGSGRPTGWDPLIIFNCIILFYEDLNYFVVQHFSAKEHFMS